MNKKSKIIGFRTTQQLYALISAEAKSRNIPVSWWLRILVKEYLAKGGIDRVNMP